MTIRYIPIFEVLMFVNYVYGNFELLSKFHQSDYKIRDLRVEIEYINKTLLHDMRAVGHKYNRTTTAFNVTFWPKIDVENKIECIVQAYKRASNEYRLFPMRYQVNLCKTIKSNVLGFQKIFSYGNFTLCNWKKDTIYSFRNFPVDESHLPPLFPSGEYKVHVQVLYFNSTMTTGNNYAEVYRPGV